MPIFEYQCESCSTVIERDVNKPGKCPRCFSRRVKRVFLTPPAVAFKGQGFTRGVRQVELGDGRRGSVNEDGFERIKKIDPDARLIST